MAENWRSEFPTDLIGERLVWNGLHYSDATCWKGFAIVEYLYSTIATPDNFIFRGVFAHVWAKDVARRYNSKLFKDKTVAHRATIAVECAKGKA
eukprot:8831693-Ditylum_brightwellii.AAC.1